MSNKKLPKRIALSKDFMKFVPTIGDPSDVDYVRGKEVDELIDAARDFVLKTDSIGISMPAIKAKSRLIQAMDQADGWYQSGRGSVTDTVSIGITDKRFNDIVDDLERIFLNVQDRDEFYGTEKGDLLKYHFTLGMRIRSAYGLWKNPWKAEMDDKRVDISPYHPHSVSQRIIVAVWERGQK